MQASSSLLTLNVILSDNQIKDVFAFIVETELMGFVFETRKKNKA
jgi:hypothetical protein